MRTARVFRLASGRLGVAVACCLALAHASGAAPSAAAAPALRNDPGAAEQQARTDLQRALSEQDAGAEINARIQLGSVARQRGRYDQAIIEFEHAAAVAKRLDDNSLYAKALANLGITLDLGGLHAEALEQQAQALALYEKAGDPKTISAMLTNLGNTLGSLGDAAKSREHYERALAMKRENGITRGVGSVLNNLADLALSDGTAQHAVTLLDQAIAAHESEGDRIGLGLALGNRGYAKAQLGRYDDALADTQRAEAIARELEHQLGIAAAHHTRAQVWLMRGRSLEGDGREFALMNADRESRQAISLADAMGDSERRRRAERVLADVLAARGEGERALSLYREIDEGERKQRDAEDRERIALISARYQDQRRNSDLALLQEREASQRLQLARQSIVVRSVVFCSVVLLLALVALAHTARDRRRQRDSLRLRERELQAQLERGREESSELERRLRLSSELMQSAIADLHGPFSAVRSQAERMLAAAPPGSDNIRSLGVMARAAADGLTVVSRLRESQRLDGEHDESEFADCALSALIADIAQQQEQRARQRQIDLLIDCPGITCRASPEALRTAIASLFELSLLRAMPSQVWRLVVTESAGEIEMRLPDHDHELHSQLSRNPDDPKPLRLDLLLLRERLHRLGIRLGADASTRQPVLVLRWLAAGEPGAS